MYNIIVYLNILIMGLVAGTLTEVALANIPMFLELPPELFVATHRILDKQIDNYMPLLTTAAFVTATGELWFSHQYFWQTASTLLGIAGIIALALISHLVNVPLNRKFRSWSSDSLDDNILEMKAKWIRSHRLRTIAGLVAFVSLLVPVLKLV